MSVNETTRKALLDMGIDATLARAAASRFHNVDAAVNWCFGDGMEVGDRKCIDLLSLRQAFSGDPTRRRSLYRAMILVRRGVKQQVCSVLSVKFEQLMFYPVQHREVIDATSLNQSSPPTPPPLPPRPNATSTTPFKSNNPFLNTPPTAPSPASTLQNDDDDDEEVRKALTMSKEDVETESRQERERSVRASGAPPPSPDGDIGGSIGTGTLLGPSERIDEEGKIAMVPISQVGQLLAFEDSLDPGAESWDRTRKLGISLVRRMRI